MPSSSAFSFPEAIDAAVFYMDHRPFNALYADLVLLRAGGDQGDRVVEVMKLDRARLCLDCEEVFEACEGDRYKSGCPRCGSGQSFFIARWIEDNSREEVNTMCDMKRNGRCRTSKHYMERCSFIRTLFCDHGAEIRKKQAETYDLVKRQEEERRQLGVGA